MEKVIVLLSGGIDSAVAAAIAAEKSYELYFLTVNYGQKNIQREIECATYLAKHFSVKEHKVIDMLWLGQLGKSLATDSTITENATSDDEIYVPYRNTVLISAAVAWAEVISADYIYTGSECGPWICPDNSPEYYAAFNNLISISTKLNPKIQVCAPLNYSDKTNNVSLGLKYGIPFDHTWTCIARGDCACGKCQPCRTRLEAFRALGVDDPLRYFGD